MNTIPPLLDELLRAPGPPGREDAVSAIVRREAAALGLELEADVLGNTTARLRGTGSGRTLALVAHVDQIGVGVQRFDDDGRLTVGPFGTWDAAAAIGQRFRVLTSTGEVPAVAVREGGDGKPAWSEIRLDLGAQDAAHSGALVSPGDAAVFSVPPVGLASGRLAAAALDDRLGVYAAIETLRVLAAQPPTWDVALVATVQEEGVTGGGAAAVAVSLRPEIAVVVECTYAADASSGQPAWGDVVLGGGPGVFRGPVVHPRVTDGLLAAAAAAGVSVAVETGNSAWCDADVLFTAEGGIATGLVSIPVRHMHTASEIGQLSDVDATTALLVAYARSLHDELTLLR